MPPTRFSIIVTFHNQRGLIKDALNSALSQQVWHPLLAQDCNRLAGKLQSSLMKGQEL
jgi:hypothetical protein